MFSAIAMAQNIQFPRLTGETGARIQATRKRRRPQRGGAFAAATQRAAAFLEIADLRFAAWFLWMTPLDAALSS